MALLSSPAASAASVRLAWDPSPDPAVVAYRIHYGVQSGVYRHSTSPLPNFSGQVSGLTEGATYYFVVTALNLVGVESRPSNEVRYQVPLPAPSIPEYEAHDAAITTLEDTPVSLRLSGAYPDQDPATYEITSFPQFGTLSGTPPALTYSPNPNFFGEDDLEFVVRGSQTVSRTAQIILNVSPVNDAPRAFSRTLSISENSSVRVTLQGSDIEKDTLTFRVIQLPRYGTLSGRAPLLTYQPFPGFTGSDFFRYIAHDGALNSSPATIRFTVYPTSLPPESQPDTLLVPEAGVASLLVSGEPSVLANDSSPSDALLQARLLTPPTEGTLTLLPNGQFSYRHFGTPSSHDQFTYVATDGLKDSLPTTVHIHVFRIVNLSESNGTMRLEFTATPQVDYVIESNDLTADPEAEWSTIDTISVESNSLVTLTDPSSLPTIARFYRIQALLRDETHLSETWGVTRHQLARGNSSFSIPLHGPRERKSRVIHVRDQSIVLEGPSWLPNQLNAQDGFPSHIAIVTDAASATRIGHWWPISHHSDRILYLDSLPGPSPAQLITPGDLVEIRQLPNLYQWFGQGADPLRQFSANQALTAFGDARQTDWSVTTMKNPQGSIGFVVSNQQSTSSLNPILDGTSLSLFPGQALLISRPDFNSLRIFPTGRIPSIPMAHYLPSGSSHAASVFPHRLRLSRADLLESDWKMDLDGFASPAKVDFISRYGATEDFTPLHYHAGSVKTPGWYSHSTRLTSTPTYALGTILKFSLAPRTQPWVWMEPVPW